MTTELPLLRASANRPPEFPAQEFVQYLDRIIDERGLTPMRDRIMEGLIQHLLAYQAEGLGRQPADQCDWAALVVRVAEGLKNVARGRKGAAATKGCVHKRREHRP